MGAPSPYMLSLAQRVARQTGLYPGTVIAVWVSEQGWWATSSGNYNNPGNITTTGPGVLMYGASGTHQFPGNSRWFLSWPTMEAGADGFAAYYNANKGPGRYYNRVAMAVGPREQLVAFGQSAYGGASPATLVSIFDSLPDYIRAMGPGTYNKPEPYDPPPNRPPVLDEPPPAGKGEPAATLPPFSLDLGNRGAIIWAVLALAVFVAIGGK